MTLSVFWSGIADWFEYSKLPPVFVAMAILLFALWNIRRYL